MTKRIYKIIKFCIKKFKHLKKRTKIILVLFIFFLLFFIIVPFFGLKVICPIISDASIPNLTIKEKIDMGNLNIEGYERPEESTYLTFPEWHLVYIPEEYANWIKDKRPSEFPYFSSVGQFWEGYCNVYEITKEQYVFNIGNHFMLWVIGTSSTVELGIKGLYENSIGRFTEWTSSYEKTEEDEFAYKFNKGYVDFLYDVPWYEFSFGSKFSELWRETDIFGSDILRKLERRGILSIELGVKTVYGGVIKLGTRLIYGKAPLEIYASVENVSQEILNKYPEVEKVIEFDGKQVIKIPRYRKFTELLPQLSKEGVHFIDIAGNDDIFLTIITPKNWTYNLEEGEVLFTIQILTDDSIKRMGIKASVKSLDEILPKLEKQAIKIEHIYDY
jgi:hypothetical protein